MGRRYTQGALNVHLCSDLPTGKGQETSVCPEGKVQGNLLSFKIQTVMAFSHFLFVSWVFANLSFS